MGSCRCDEVDVTAAKSSDLAKTGTNHNTAAIAGMAAALIAAGGVTALAVRRHKTRHAA